MRLLPALLAAALVSVRTAFAQIAPMEIVTTPTRSGMPVREESADTVVVTQDDLQTSGQPAMDDALRPLPGFNTFRRSSSIVTAPADDPEAQGVTLRGIGPGGASRALVLYDGVPVNDAFGGWIYWDEIPLDSIASVELVNGAVPLWGNGAEGGVINLMPERAVGRGFQITSSYGTRNTFGASLLAGYSAGPFQLQFDGTVFNTGGWNIIAPAFRGPLDHNSSSFHALNSGRIQYRPNDHLTLFIAGHYYDAKRDLGTPLRKASANRYFFEGGGSLHTRAGTFGLVAYSHVSSMDQAYSLVNQPRTAELRRLTQHVPSTDVGGSLTWTKTIVAHDQLLAGGDFRWIDGQSDDSYYDTTGSAVDDRKVSAGRQNFFGAFAEDVYRPFEKFEADLSARADVFQNLAGQIQDSPGGGKTTITDFVDRTRTATSSRLGLRYAPWRSLTLRGGLYEAFRAPTLAELYRQSSVESLVLLPNPKLAPEFLQGGEIGLELTPPQPFTLTLIGYWNILRRPIGNLVTATNPLTGADTERTRENLGRARIRGYEVRAGYDLNWVPWRQWSLYNPRLRLGIDYLRSEAELTYNPPDATLEGRRLALVPWNSGTGEITYQDDRIGRANLQIAFQGMQWEDSDNHDRQPAYWLVNLSWSHALPSLPQLPRLKETCVYARVQNLLDHSYVIDRAGGIPKLGTPLMLEGGFTAPLWF